MPNRARSLVLTLLACLGSAAGARADLLTTFNGTSPSTDVAMQAYGTAYLSSPVGPFNFTVAGSSTDTTFAPGSTFRAFCGDLFQDVSANQQYAYSVGPLSSLPSIGGDTTKAALVERLFNRHYESATDANNGGAFQLALWELLADGPGNLNLGSGNMSVSSPDSVPAVAIAKTWLSALETVNPNDSAKYQLVGLYSDTAQDQITVVPNAVPAPAGIVLGLLAAGGFAVRRLRRAKTV